MKDTAIDSLNSLKKAICLFKISPGFFPSCTAHDYPFTNCVKGILKQFCSVTVAVGGAGNVGQKQLYFRASSLLLPSQRNITKNACHLCYKELSHGQANNFEVSKSFFANKMKTN